MGDPGVYLTYFLKDTFTYSSDYYLEMPEFDNIILKSVEWNGNKWADTEENYLIDWSCYINYDYTGPKEDIVCTFEASRETFPWMWASLYSDTSDCKINQKFDVGRDMPFLWDPTDYRYSTAGYVFYEEVEQTRPLIYDSEADKTAMGWRSPGANYQR